MAAGIDGVYDAAINGCDVGGCGAEYSGIGSAKALAGSAAVMAAAAGNID